MTTRARASAALLLVPVLLLAACSTSGSAASTGDEAAATTITVEDMTGDVEVPAEPTAALGMYTTDVDILITLGYPLAGSQPVRDEGYQAYPSFFPDEVDDVETFTNFPEYNYEAILAAQPDFILNGLGYDDEVVEKLPEIAPTFSFNGFDGRDWREIFHETAIALDREDRYQAWTDTYEARVAEIKAELDAAGIDPVVGPVDYWDGQVNASCYGVPCLVFDDLGLEITPLARVSEDGTKLSSEQLSQLSDIDVFFTTSTPADDGTYPDVFEPVASNPLWQALPAVQSGQIYTGDLEMLYGSPSGQMAYLEFVADSLLG